MKITIGENEFHHMPLDLSPVYVTDEFEGTGQDSKAWADRWKDTNPIPMVCKPPVSHTVTMECDCIPWDLDPYSKLRMEFGPARCRTPKKRRKRLRKKLAKLIWECDARINSITRVDAHTAQIAFETRN